MPFVNGLLKKKGLQQLVQYSYLRYGRELTVHDARRSQGPRLSEYATKSGISIGIDDMRRSGREAAKAGQRSAGGGRSKVEKQYELEGAITHRKSER